MFILLRNILLVALTVSSVSVGTVNSALRYIGGGYPHLFSTRHFEHKLQALDLWARHLATHPFRDSHPNPRTLLREAADRHGVPPSLVRAMAEAESELKPHRISATGAMGLMQLMPGTARDLKVQDPFDSRQNIDGGVRYIRYLWKRYRGDPKRVVAAYNTGPGNVPKKGKLRLPRQTKHYVKRVLKRARRLRQRERPRASRPSKPSRRSTRSP